MMEGFIVISICEPSGKTDRSQDMHREKRTVQENEGEKEMHLPPELIHCSPKHFGKPEINGGPDTHCRPCEEDIMKMSHDEICIVNENINWRGCHKNARQTTNDEH